MQIGAREIVRYCVWSIGDFVSPRSTMPFDEEEPVMVPRKVDADLPNFKGRVQSL
jgi:hypothetical protein